VTVQTDYPDCCPHTVQYIAIYMALVHTPSNTSPYTWHLYTNGLTLFGNNRRTDVIVRKDVNDSLCAKKPVGENPVTGNPTALSLFCD
jgi:hypothetical protein